MRTAILLGAALAFTASVATAQSWPTQPVKIISPFPPGGGTDVLARALTEKMSGKLGQPVVVENRTGASGNVGADVVAKSPPDGHTLLMAATIIATYKYTYSKLPFDALTDLTAVGTVADTPNLLVVHPNSSIRDLQSLMAAANAKSGGLSYGSAGLGSPQHIATEMLARLGNFKMHHVPYRGVVPAVTDVMGNQIDVACISLPAVIAQIEARKLHAVAVLSSRRSPLAPTIPTAEESGIKGMDSSVRFVLLAPTRTPAAVVQRLNAVLNEVLADPAIRQSFARAGYEPHSSTPGEATAMIKREYDLPGPVINGLNLENSRGDASSDKPAGVEPTPGTSRQ